MGMLLGDCMKYLLSGAALIAGFALAVPASAAPGQCSMTGFDSFDCDVTVDGGGISFALPDGRTFVFAHIADGEGLGYMIPSDVQPGRSPVELGTFTPVEDEPGCWSGGKEETKFCAAISQ